MKVLQVTLVTLLFVSSYSIAQDKCGQHVLERALRASDPAMEARFQQFNAEVMHGTAGQAQRAETKIIPVIFHVIHNNGSENIADEQIYDAMRIMNKDFNAKNPELEEVIPAFQDIIGDGDIEFRLARFDPDGNETIGIERIQSSETYVGDDGSKLNPWPRDKYLNIWVTDAIAISEAAAYAYRPPAADGTPSIDGVISNHRYVGSIGTGNPGSSSKTLTHEVGHYLGLSHTWGETNDPGVSSNCFIDDEVDDTPNCIGVDNSSCDLDQSTCGELDNIQNFMDYASCEAMFTEGQIAVMRTVLSNSLAERNELSQVSNLEETGVNDLHEAKFWVERRSVCRGESIQFFDESPYDAESWNWTITGPETFTSSEQHPTFEFKRAGIYTVELSVSKGAVTKSVKEEKAFAVVEVYGLPVPFKEDFSQGDSGWLVNKHEEMNNNSWKYETVVGFDDSYSYKMTNLGQEPNRVDDLTFSSIDFRPLTNVSISYKVAYSRISNLNDDRLQLEVSDDCAQTWQTVWSATGAALSGSKPLSTTQFIPEASDWEQFSVSNLPLGWFSGNTLLRFRFISGGGNNLYLDDINVYGDYDPVPKLVYPANGAPSMNDNVVLDWHAAPGVSAYEYELDISPDFNSGSLQTGTLSYISDASDNEDTKLTTSGLTHGQQYFWRVRAEVNSTSTAWSDVWSFTVASDGVGITERAGIENIHLFPNPAQDRLLIVSEAMPDMRGFCVYDLRGQLVKHSTPVGHVTTWTLEVGDLENGTYILKIEAAGEPVFTPFTVAR